MRRLNPRVDGILEQLQATLEDGVGNWLDQTWDETIEDAMNTAWDQLAQAEPVEDYE